MATITDDQREDRYEARDRERVQQFDQARRALAGNAPAIIEIADRMVGDLRVALHRRAMRALMPAVHETAHQIANDALEMITKEVQR
jgi:hypothetical protein